MDEDKKKGKEEMESMIDRSVMDEVFNTQTRHSCLGLPPLFQHEFPCFINRAEVLVTPGL